MTSTTSIAPRESAAPSALTDGPFDLETDVVVVGGGGAGIPAALFSRWLGNEVLIVEKAPELGGTSRKAAFWYWVPNNEPLRRSGLTDPEDDYLRYVARLSRPENYDPTSPTLGLTAWEHELMRAIYASASPAAELLNERGALVYRHCPDVLDYWSELPEDATPTGRVLVPADAKTSMADGGEVAIASLSAAARRDGVEIRTGVRVQRLVLDGRAVAGVEGTTATGETLRIRARRAVVFASGGFAHDDDLRVNFLNYPVFPGATCAVPTNEGDFIAMAGHVGAQLRNMNHAWMGPMSMEKAVRRDPTLGAMSSAAGDSSVFVDLSGERRVNEKLQYNELAHAFFRWDGVAGVYPDRVMIQVWDERSQQHSASAEYGRMIVPPDSDQSHVVVADDLESLASELDARLERYAPLTGGLRLAPDFVPRLARTIERFNGFAERGVDDDFRRGELPIQVAFNGDVETEPHAPNPTMFPISPNGPYYAGLVVGGILDTKGGPRTTADAQVVDDSGIPIPGLYGVGNCVASVSAGSYWAGGATLGPMIAFAHRAANSIGAPPHTRKGNHMSTTTPAVVPVVTRKGHEIEQTGQSNGAHRVSGVSPQHTPATRIWFGKVTNEPGTRSVPHHHGEAETGGYLLSGHGRIYYGEDYALWFDFAEGDFVFVPPYMPHVEANMSVTDELVWLTTRTPDNIVVNLPEVDDSTLEGFRRV